MSPSRRSSRTVLVTGAGGVGKTTVSAALAVAASRKGIRTLVLTVDPARRLADALGIEAFGNDPVPVGDQPGLWAAMLDVTDSWEGIIQRHTDPAVADRLSANPFFRAIADRFPAAQAYAAGEQLAEYLEAGAWQLLIVDTPPAGGGIDFFHAPRRMRDLFGGKVLRWLTGASLPGRRALYRVTARPMLRITDAVLGGPLLEELADFVIDLRTLHDGLTRRARTIERYLGEATTLVVTTAHPAPLREVRRFFEELDDIASSPTAVLFNRSLPTEWAAPDPDLPDGDVDETLRIVLHDNLRRWAAEARRQAHTKSEFSHRHKTTAVSIPWFDHPPNDLDSLVEVVASADVDLLGHLGLRGTS